MVRPSWRGSISFGLVNVPVRLFTAVRSKRVRFRQLSAKTHAPVEQRRVDSQTGDEVAYRDLVKGYEQEDGSFVVIDPAELDELAPDASRLIEIQDFVLQSEIDPVYYDQPYYLAPESETAAKPYRLLVEAMARSGKVAIVRFVLREREHLAALRARDGLLVLSTMHYADEVVDPAEIDADWGESAKLSEREVAMAEELIASLHTDFDPSAYRDSYRDRLLELIDAKREGITLEAPAPSPAPDNVVDLVAALEQSLRARSGGGSSPSAPATTTTRGEAASHGTSHGEGDYEQMTRDQLYELARDRDLPGRSGLSKAELVALLRAEDRRAGAA